MVNRIISCLKNIGIYVDDEENLDIDINDYIEDSITFITFVVELEREFNIEIPDDYLIPTQLNTISNILNLIKELSDINAEKSE